MLELALFGGAMLGAGQLQKFGFGAATKAYAARRGAAKGLAEGSWRFGSRTGSLERSFGRKMQRDTWKAFFGTRGGLTARWSSANIAAQKRMTRGFGKIATVLPGALPRATAAALGAGALNVGLNYFMYGNLAPMFMDMAVGGFNALADVGRKLKDQGPSTTTRFVDTRQAATMRQAGLQAIHESGMGGYRNSLGGEARLAHR
jgi:hypothetical protein